MANTSNIKLIDSWKKRLSSEFEQEYMQELKAFLIQEKQQGKQIFPHSSLWFNALNTTPYEDVKVVILGQDPYPTPGHAHGLCFSVLPDVKPLAKSLINIFKELETDLGIQNSNGCLQNWAKQGVLLLNSVLTVESGKPNSHQNKGWEQFTDKIMQVLNQSKQPIVFVLWGAYAQKKGQWIDNSLHQVINAPHPSPLSAYRGFFGSQPFSKINQFLQQHNRQTINWSTD
ncbi:MAG: uracil-DNA glycosylase [Gammaproteobacteria bacterium]|nr:uracil-DNA glycosylase [Gammaproteobacteria bacterium]